MYPAVVLGSVVGLLVLAVVVVVLVVVMSPIGAGTQIANFPHPQQCQSTDDLRAENQRLKAQLAQLEASANHASELMTENTRLNSRVALLEAAAAKAQFDRAAAETTVGENATTSRPSSNPIVQQWHLEDAVVEVKVLQLRASPSGSHLAIHVTNRSKALIEFWEVGASVYDRAGKYLGNGTKVGSNLRSNSSVDEEMLLMDVDSGAVTRWVLQLKQINVESDSGEKLYNADKYFTLKEVKDP